jgi:hypothetical protein
VDVDIHVWKVDVLALDDRVDKDADEADHSRLIGLGVLSVAALIDAALHKQVNKVLRQLHLPQQMIEQL